MREISPLERAVRFKRIAGGPISAHEITLEVLEPIVLAETKAAQVLKVIARGINEDQPVVTKFYDCTLANHEERDVDPPAYVDNQYITETAAYRKLSNFYDISIPRYFGSFTCDFHDPSRAGHSSPNTAPIHSQVQLCSIPDIRTGSYD
jgi:hypothetical protein